MKLLKKRKLLNSYESILFAYLFMFFALISSRYEYLECFNCGLNYKLIVSFLYSVVFVSYQILTLNAFFNKQRNQIRGSTKKIVAQKGSGGARHASKKAPLFVGGGVAHGPKGLNYKIKKINK